MTKKERLFLILILLVGIFFRFFLIGKMPGGLFPDEAANGLDINNIFHGHLLPFFARGNGRESMFFYFEALSTWIFGRGFWQFHIVSATIGVISIFTTFLFAKRLYGVRTGLLAAFLMAVGTWHIVLSRTAFRAVQIPLFTTITLYFIIRTLQAKTQKEKMWSAVFSGIFFSLGFYTYIAYRIMPVILGFLLVVILIADWKQKFAWAKEHWQAFWVAAVAAIITIIPIGYYFLTHPGSFIGRSGQVSVFNPDLNHGHLIGTVIDVTVKSVTAYFKNGDTNWRQNISGLPFISPMYSIFFGIALVCMTILGIKFIVDVFRKKPRDLNFNNLKHLTVITLFWGMLLPVITTAEGIPHGLRSIGTTAPAYIISAIGLVWFIRWALRVWHHKWMEYIYVAVAILFCGGLIYLSYVQYFVYAYNTPENFEAFRSDLSSVSDYLNSHPDAPHTFLVLDTFSVQTVDYLTTQTNNPYTLIDPANSYKAHLLKGDNVIFTGSTLPDAAHFTQTHKNLALKAIIKNKFGLADMVDFELTANDTSESFAHNPDYSFKAINFGKRIDFSWQNQSFDPWVIDIWQCSDPACTNPTLLKENNQNDYFANNDHIDNIDATQSDLYFKAVGYGANHKILKDFGIIKVPQYK